MTDGHGIPLATVLAGANRTAMKNRADLLEATVLPLPAEEDEAVLAAPAALGAAVAVADPPATSATASEATTTTATTADTRSTDAAVHKRTRNRCLDRGYDYTACRTTVAEQGDEGHIPATGRAAQPRPAPSDPERPPPRRWVGEVAHRWFNRWRRLLIRWEQQAAT